MEVVRASGASWTGWKGVRTDWKLYEAVRERNETRRVALKSC